jgi:hypothetical protein
VVGPGRALDVFARGRGLPSPNLQKDSVRYRTKTTSSLEICDCNRVA